MAKLIKDVFDKKGAPLLIGLFVALFVAETVSILRSRKQSRAERIKINSAVAIPGFIALRLVLLPAMVWVASKNEQWKVGINPVGRNHPAQRQIAAFLLLDYFNYVWHILNHKVDLLWRFHLVHHTDADLDVTTAIRFHVGEMFTSVFYRSFTSLLSGASPLTILVYEICFEGATQFHHSNWKLPLPVEALINKVIVTPRMHGIHHSMARNETDSNYSVIFSFWDRVHQTLNLSREQHEIVIGIPSYSDPGELTVAKLLRLPFTSVRKWGDEQKAILKYW